LLQPPQQVKGIAKICCITQALSGKERRINLKAHSMSGPYS
jgi:hypothetical protein